jgi:hypothetical protein
MTNEQIDLLLLARDEQWEKAMKWAGMGGLMRTRVWTRVWTRVVQAGLPPYAKKLSAPRGSKCE